MKLLAVLPVGVVAMSMTGCGNNASANRAEEVQKLSDKYALVQKAGLSLEDKDRVYSATLPADHPMSLGGMAVPADYSPHAVRLDEFNAMRPDILQAYQVADATVSQKAVLARMLGEIDLANARYLGAAASTSYEHARSGVNDLQHYADQIDAFEGIITVYTGDRAVIVETLRTGDAGGGLQIDGIEQLTRRAESIQGRLDEAASKYEGYQAEAMRLAQAVTAHEANELEWKGRARTLEGPPQFDALDEAVDEWLKARLAEIESEYNLLLAETEAQNAAFNESDLAQVEAVMSTLRESIAQVQADIDALQGEVRQARSDRDDAADILSDAFDAVDQRMQTLVFARLDRAASEAASSAGFYSSITTSGQARTAIQQHQLNALLNQLQLIHQHAIALSGYKSAIDTLAANGDQILGRNLAGTLAQRSEDIVAQIEQLKQTAEPVQQAAEDLAGVLTNPAGAGSDDATLLSEQSDHLEAIRSGMGDLPFE